MCPSCTTVARARPGLTTVEHTGSNIADGDGDRWPPVKGRAAMALRAPGAWRPRHEHAQRRQRCVGRPPTRLDHAVEALEVAEDVAETRLIEPDVAAIRLDQQIGRRPRDCERAP